MVTCITKCHVYAILALPSALFLVLVAERYIYASCAVDG